MSRALAVVAIAAGLGVTGCGGDDESSDPEPSGGGTAAESPVTEEASAEKAAAQKEAAAGTTVKLGDSQYGRILFGGNDQAIYLFDKEGGPTSECYGECAAAWPPVLTEGEPRAAGGASAGMLGTTERDDGSVQLTYNGHPLYYYAHEGPGEVTCHDVEEFGGLWLVLDAAGDAV